ncbi:MAG TPA: AraC family transcriptional regulator, partial [Vicinamibacterales bacterium]|nr:AraC family transcriptional regulator [Vicinamibacterales bacterium]
LQDCEPHFHDTYPVGLVRKGTVHLTVGRRIVRVEPGEVVVVHPYEVHGGGSADELIECDILYPSIDLMIEATGLVPCGGGYPCFDSPLFRQSPATMQLRTCLDRFRDRERRSAATADGGVVDALHAVLVQGAPGSARWRPIAGGRSSVDQALDIMLRQVASIRRPGEITERLGVSPFHFSRVFHRAIGVSPIVFLRQLRVARARTLIVDGMALADVAVDAGFFDQPHMNREFKSVFGFPPGQLARTVRDRN